MSEYLGSLKSTIFPVSRNSNLSDLRWNPGIGILKNASGDSNEAEGTEELLTKFILFILYLRILRPFSFSCHCRLTIQISLGIARCF
jgi:hypothetical protein